jgi:hypothetical protein
MSMAYKAFLSYSRADSALAAAIQSALHRFAKPWYRLRAVHVFRDATNLPANPELWPTIQSALEASEFFILLASPEAAASAWVGREIEHWCATKGAAAIVIATTGGTAAWDEEARDFDWERTTALPRTLSGRFAAEPLWVDLSWTSRKEEQSLQNERFRGAIATIAAPLHGRSKEELDGEDIRQHRRTRRLMGWVLVTLCLLVAIAYWQHQVAESRRRIGLSRQLAAQAAALLDEQYDRALLLAMAAWRFAPTLEARNGLLSDLAAAPHPITFLHQAEGINRLAFSPGDEFLAAGSGGEDAIVVWDLAHGPPTRRTMAAGAEGNYLSLAFARSEDVFFASTRTGIVLWNARTGRPEGRFDSASGADSLTLGADGRLIAFLDGSGAMHLRSRDTRAELAPVMATDVDDSVRLWNVGSGKPIGPPLAAVSAVNDVALSPNGEMLAMTDGAGVVRLWDVPSGQRLGPPLARKKGAAFHFAFRDDSALLAVVEEDWIVLWDVAIASWQQRARAAANRNLTPEEWRHYIPDDAYEKMFEDLP